MLTKEEIQRMVSFKLQDTHGMTGEVSTLKARRLLSDEELAFCSRYAYEMFPCGGWEWMLAFNDKASDIANGLK